MDVEHLWLVGGGELGAAFIEESLLTHVSLSLMPIVLGDGVKLFGSAGCPTQLKLESSESRNGRFVQVEYSLDRVLPVSVHAPPDGPGVD